ncbi:General transcription factor IIF subunit 2, partial [Ophiophagus hannah]
MHASLLGGTLLRLFSNSTLSSFRLQIEESSKPVSWTMQLDKAVTTNYKPVANHHYNVRGYVGFDITYFLCSYHVAQSISPAFFQIYLKEILREIGIYNFKGPHKSTWELKPEYRHYQNEDKSD